jgi:hypothetical protein
MGNEYSLSITESLTSPWQAGEGAIQSFSEKFGLAMSATVEELNALEAEFKQTMLELENVGSTAVGNVQNSASSYVDANNPVNSDPLFGYGSDGNSSIGFGSSGGGYNSAPSYPYGKASETTGNIKKGAKGNAVKAIQYALNQLGYGNSGTKSVDGNFGSGTRDAVKAFQKAMGIKVDGIVGKDTRAKFKLKGYATGTTGVDKDQWALINELGEELVLHAGPTGKLEYLTKGSGVVASDLTEKLIGLAMNPQSTLDRNRPSIGVSPSVINNTNEIHIDASVGTLMHIDNLNGDNPDEILKIVNQALDKHTKQLNNAIKRYTR